MEAKTAVVLTCFASLAAAAAQAPPPARTPATALPVREVTAFKDGHAFVLRSGPVPLPADDRIVLDELPARVLGTFWPAVGGDQVKLRAVTAGRRRVVKPRTALELKQMLLANPGADVIVRETGDVRYAARIVGIPTQPGDEVAAASGRPGPAVATTAEVVLLRTDIQRKDTSAERVTDAGTRVVRLDRIVDLTFTGDYRPTYADEQIQPQLELAVTPTGARPATVPVTLAWLEHGFRWIPSYRVVLDGKGQAQVRMQATLVDDLVDLDDATVHLVVGVPSFVAKGQLDPIALQETAAAVAANARNALFNSQMASNMFQTQGAMANNGAPVAADEGDGSAESRKAEDLFVFTVPHVTLRRGERMVLPVAEFSVPYHDLWKLDVGVTPPREFGDAVTQGNPELARLLANPRVRHEIRLENTGKAPFTTAPALVLLGDTVLAQGMCTYTPPGQSCDVGLTTAVDIAVKKEDHETGRTPNAVHWNGATFSRVDLAGTLRLRNRRSEPVTVEVSRTVLGKLLTVTDGKVEQMQELGEEDLAQPWHAWLGRGYAWSSWWHAVNGVGRASWTVTIPPGKDVTLECTWQYHWN